MDKSALDYVHEIMLKNAKKDSASSFATGWEAIEDLARLKLDTQTDAYLIQAIIEYLATQPYPTAQKPPTNERII